MCLRGCSVVFNPEKLSGGCGAVSRRVMRRAEGKELGYVILPVVTPLVKSRKLP